MMDYIDVKSTPSIGLDLHGVLDTHADKMIPLLKDLFEQGVVIHVLSGPSKNQVEQELQDLGYLPEIHYHYVFSVVDYLKSEQVEMWKDTNNTWWAQDEVWWKSKGYYCKITHCEYLFDNSERYQEYMSPMTEFKLINDEQSAQEMIELLEKIKNEVNDG